jgi:restriction system protein
MPQWRIAVQHDGLGKVRFITGNDKFAVARKAEEEHSAWENEWSALTQTRDAQTSVRELQTVLKDGLAQDHSIRWGDFKQPFLESPPRLPPVRKLPPEPQPSDPRFALSLSAVKKFLAAAGLAEEIIDEVIADLGAHRPEQQIHIFRRPRVLPASLELALRRRRSSVPATLSDRVEGVAARLSEDSAQRFRRAKVEWEEKKRQIEQARELVFTRHASRMTAWRKRKAKFLADDESPNRVIDQWRAGCVAGEPQAMEKLIDTVLSRSRYPTCCPKEHRVHFTRETGVIVIDFRLPGNSDLPTVKGMRYVAVRNAFEGLHLKPNEVASLYDDLVFQICLRTVHEVYQADASENIKAVVFNGWVEFTDPATGKPTRSCIISMQAEREAFCTVNLARVDPRACFKAFKGVGSSKLHSMVAVPPLIRINREDARFVESVEIADRLREGTNLAAIGWEDFEHLIREIFEKEFSGSGGEVKVTRASRDGGVDAIAFDPDPIRGGKIVIQAKRYINTVEVSAVRDLYGTVVNEGAIKGILVTTSTFGPDAYAFAKDKPLTLLDGGNLLHLLERHGHRAYVDLAEAKRLNTMPLARSTAR